MNIKQDVFETIEKILPYCQENGLVLFIMDNDPKLQSKNGVAFMAENGMRKYIPGRGEILVYPPCPS